MMDRGFMRTLMYACAGCLLLFINYSVGNDLFMFIFLALASMSILLSSFKNALICLLIYSSFMEIIRFSFSGINFYFVLLGIFILKGIMVTRKYNRPSVFYYLLFVMCLLPTFNRDNSMSIAVYIITFLSYLCLFIIANNVRKIRFPECVIAHSSGFILSSVLGLLAGFMPRLYETIKHETIYGYGREASRFTGVSYDTNVYALICITTIALLLVISKVKRYRKISILYIVILSVFGFATFSKMFIIVYAILCLIYLLFVLKLRPSRVVITILTIFLCFILVRSIIGADYFSILFSRFGLGSGWDNSITLNEITTNRSGLWSDYSQNIISNPKILFFGSGLLTLSGTVAHNTFLQIIYLVGIVGLTAFVLFLISFYKCYPRNKKIVFANILPLFTLLACLFSLSMFTNTILWIMWFLAIAALTYKEEIT